MAKPRLQIHVACIWWISNPFRVVSVFGYGNTHWTLLNKSRKLSDGVSWMRSFKLLRISYEYHVLWRHSGPFSPLMGEYHHNLYSEVKIRASGNHRSWSIQYVRFHHPRDFPFWRLTTSKTFTEPCRTGSGNYRACPDRASRSWAQVITGLTCIRVLTYCFRAVSWQNNLINTMPVALAIRLLTRDAASLGIAMGALW